MANNLSANGVFSYTSTSAFPTSTYNANNYWVDVLFQPTPPGQPTGVAATAGYGAATVNWSAPATGGATKYTVTPYIGATAQTATTVTGTPPATTATVTGLTPGTAYTFTVQASNSNGNGPVSAASNSVTPLSAAAPAAPTGVTASPATTQALVSWNAAAPNGSPVTAYTVTPYLAGLAQTPVQVNNGSATSATITGLTNGTRLHVHRLCDQRPGDRRPVRRDLSRHAARYDLRLRRAGRIGLRRRQLRQPGSQVHRGHQRPDRGDPLLQGGRQYGHPQSAASGPPAGHCWRQRPSPTKRPRAGRRSCSRRRCRSPPARPTSPATSIQTAITRYSAAAFNTSFDNPPLHAVANSVSANGLYNYSATSTFPTSFFNANNYWVDVLFAPGS